MKKTTNKTKLSIATLGTAIISFLSKVLAQERENPEQRYSAQTLYGVANPEPSPETIILITIKLLQRLLLAVVLVLGIINFIKIRKIDDKIQKKEKIKKTIITVVVMVIIILLLSVAAYRLSIL